jgi:hypothetical protein
MQNIDEIINQLKINNMYDIWLSHGSYFGQISNTIKAKYFLVRPYIYKDMYNNSINVSMISKNFRFDVTNIPVFKQIIIDDITNVKQGKYKIVNINETLSTCGLATCTALGIIVGKIKIFTHLDATTNIFPIVTIIYESIIDQNINTSAITKINIYAGNLNSSLTIEKAYKILNLLCININKVNIEYVFLMDKIIF